MQHFFLHTNAFIQFVSGISQLPTFHYVKYLNKHEKSVVLHYINATLAKDRQADRCVVLVDMKISAESI